LPHAQLADVTESDQALANASGIRNARQDGDSVLLEIGSGQYHFAVNQKRTEANAH
jgi:hypothetical protein